MLLYYLAKYAVRLHERAHTAECGQSCVAVSFAAQFPINLTSFSPTMHNLNHSQRASELNSVQEELHVQGVNV